YPSPISPIIISLLFPVFFFLFFFFFFFFNDTATTEIYTLSLHDALPISFNIATGQPHTIADLAFALAAATGGPAPEIVGGGEGRSEEHTSELQSRFDLVCRLLLEKKKK